MNEIHPKSKRRRHSAARTRARAMGSPGDEDIVASLADERRRVEELREKLRGAVKKGKAFEREKESLHRALDEARASKAAENESASKALETKKLVVLRAELESFKVENERLREKLDAAERSETEEEEDASDSERRDEDEESGDEERDRRTSKAARMRLQIAKHKAMNERLVKAANDARAEAASATASANAEKMAAETARRAAEEEKEMASQARANAESEHVESAQKRAEAEARVSTLESELESLKEEYERSEGRLAHLSKTFESKQEEYETRIASMTASAQGETHNDRADAARAEAELKQTKESLRDARAEIERLKSSDAMETALAAREAESVWKERAAAAMREAYASHEAYETQMNNMRAEGGDDSSSSTVADVLAAEQRAKDAENALTEARQEIASLTAERARDSGAHLSKDASSLSRRLAETEALLLKKNEQIDSLTRRFTDLAWRSTIEKRGALNASSSPTAGASVSASAVSGADGLTPLAYRRPLNRRLETVLRHRRFIIGTYLAFLHLLAYEYLFA